ncbi:hypothetical protein HNP38_002086 [Chryseobacterium defluvii]|uniref:Uncharacterized protein n=1 Tax=Chryseobacterium defluvii TaxID=160396 RepID=A0A840KH05_9FLAO|nr:hypothetical protein [Chryseobacterium defluvii]MBB4806790.1 hypothetical protein [Chryseobacterium defluvii]
MRKIKLGFLLLTGMIALMACSKKKPAEDTVGSVDKKASIETELSVQHMDTADVLITKHKIWKNNKLFKEIIKRDTIPSLEDTMMVVGDKDGYEHTAKVKKDYEFFITVQ